MGIFDLKLSSLLYKDFILIRETILSNRMNFNELYPNEVIYVVESLYSKIKDSFFEGKYFIRLDENLGYSFMEDIRFNIFIKLLDYKRYNTYNPLKHNMDLYIPVYLESIGKLLRTCLYLEINAIYDNYCMNINPFFKLTPINRVYSLNDRTIELKSGIDELLSIPNKQIISDVQSLDIKRLYSIDSLPYYDSILKIGETLNNLTLEEKELVYNTVLSNISRFIRKTLFFIVYAAK